jgi:hypothetical protein
MTETYTPTQEEVRWEERLRTILREGLPGYEDSHKVTTRIAGMRPPYFGYDTNGQNTSEKTTQFHLNIVEEGTGWIDGIELGPGHERNRRRMVECIERFFREYGCHRIRLSESLTKTDIWAQSGYEEISSMLREKRL